MQTESSPKTSALRISVVTAMFGLMASWGSLAFRGATLLELTETALSLIQDAKLSFMMVLALGALLMPFYKHLIKTPRQRHAVLGASAILISGGMAFCAMDTAATAHPFPFVSFGLALSGLGAALSTPFLGILFFDVGPKATTMSMLVGYALSAALTSLVWELPTGGRFAATLLLPVLQVGLMALYLSKLETPSGALRIREAEAQERPSLSHRLPLPAGLLIVVVLSGFLGSFVRGAMYYAGFEYAVIAAESLAIQFVALTVLTIVLGFFGKGYDTFSIFWPWAALPLLACCVALPFVGDQSPTTVATFFTIAHSFCNVFNYTIFVDIANRYNRDITTMFCWERSFDSIGCILGFVSGSLFAASFSFSAHLWYVLSFVSSYAIIILVVLVLRNRHVADFNIIDLTVQSYGSPSDSKTDYQAIAAKYQLTDRETEVLQQLDQGRSIPYISQELLVSPSTVKTHVQAIYRKLDVHTRQELLDAIRCK